MASDEKDRVFPTAREDASAARRKTPSPQTLAPAYRLAYEDEEFLMRDDARPVRLQLEFLKPEVLQQEYGIESTVVIFGSTRIPDRDTALQRLQTAEAALRETPDDVRAKGRVQVAERILAKCRYYDEAQKLVNIITSYCQSNCSRAMVVITGGGPGIMEAANRGAHEAGGESIGLNIVLPHEQTPNRYITPDLCFQFHYFAIRKMHFLMRAKALVAFPGGYGTLDELFETLTLIQTRKVKPVPVLLFGREFWSRIINFEELVLEGTIDPEDLNLFQYVETADEAWRIIRLQYGLE